MSSVTQVTATIGSTADFKNTLTYDNLQRLTQLKQEDQSGGNAVADKRLDFTYNARGQFSTITRYASLDTSELVVTSNYGYDNIGRLTSLDHVQSSTTLAGYDLAYDAASRITSIDSYADGLSEFDYDNTSQLIGADHTGQTDEAYSFDENGNRTMSGYDIDPNNHLASDGVLQLHLRRRRQPPHQDQDLQRRQGRIHLGPPQPPGHDHLQELAAAPSSRRSIRPTTPSTSGSSAASIPMATPAAPPLMTPTSATWTARSSPQFDGAMRSDLTNRTFGTRPPSTRCMADEAVTSLSSAGTVLWPFADHLGHDPRPRQLQRRHQHHHHRIHRRYDSYGNLVSESNAAVDQIFGYTGRAFDDSTSLQNNVNRWYDANTGRWISEDPIGFEADDTNLARYVGNLPTRYIDPSGLWQRPGQSETTWSWDQFPDYATFNDSDKEQYARGCIGLANVRLGYTVNWPYEIPGCNIRQHSQRSKVSEGDSKSRSTGPICDRCHPNANRTQSWDFRSSFSPTEWISATSGGTLLLGYHTLAAGNG